MSRKKVKAWVGIGLISAIAVGIPSVQAREIKEVFIQQAECGSQVYPQLMNGIGNVLIGYRDGNQMIYENHLVVNSDLCRRVPSTVSLSPDGKAPYLVAAAADYIFYGKMTIANAVISDEGLEQLNDVTSVNFGSLEYKKFFDGLEGDRTEDFIAQEWKPAPRSQRSPSSITPQNSNVEMTETQMRMLTNYDIEYIIGKDLDEPVSGSVSFRKFEGDDLVVNAYLQSGPTGCYRVTLGETTSEGQKILRVKDFVRDPSCDREKVSGYLFKRSSSRQTQVPLLWS